jgi:hypothetical protein
MPVSSCSRAKNSKELCMYFPLSLNVPMEEGRRKPLPF